MHFNTLITDIQNKIWMFLMIFFLFAKNCFVFNFWFGEQLTISWSLRLLNFSLSPQHFRHFRHTHCITAASESWQGESFKKLKLQPDFWFVPHLSTLVWTSSLKTSRQKSELVFLVFFKLLCVSTTKIFSNASSFWARPRKF